MRPLRGGLNSGDYIGDVHVAGHHLGVIRGCSSVAGGTTGGQRSYCYKTTAPTVATVMVIKPSSKFSPTKPRI
jgi:hypothetical protein